MIIFRSRNGGHGHGTLWEQKFIAVEPTPENIGKVCGEGLYLWFEVDRAGGIESSPRLMRVKKIATWEEAPVSE